MNEYYEDKIKDSKYAYVAYLLSFIPVIGFLLFIILCAISFIEMGYRFRTGWAYIKRGWINITIVNLVFFILYFGLYFTGYSSYEPLVYDIFYSFLPKHGVCRAKVIEDDWADPRMEIQYWRYGIREGKWTYWWNGKKEQEYEYKNGQLEGEWIRWSDDYIYQRTEYKNGKKNGNFIEYRNSSNYLCKGQYKDDVKIGKWTYYDYGNKIRSISFYDDLGNLIRKEENDNGN